ncbi:MAG TPA: glycosyltransferase family 39 protein, partial [Xanthobacteraceae bacterium]|nr:glycosyltransferase family 39 protein [Xanthobacteraceae bacterium]
YSVFPSVLLMKALGPAAVALAGWLVFRLARRIVGEQHGALATLAMVGVTPVSFPVGALDSATIQMPIVAGIVLAWWRAMREGNRAAWILLGVTSALTLYAGVQGLFVLAVLLVISITGSGKAAMRKHGTPALALAALIVFALIAAPRLWWLATHNFSGLYESAATGFETLGVLKPYEAAGGAIAGHLGLLLLIAVATPLLTGGRLATVAFTRAPLSGFAIVAAAVIATIPFFAAALVAIAFNVPITADAFASLLLYSGLLAFLFAGETVRLCRQRLAVTIVCVLLVLPPVAIVAINFGAPFLGRGMMTNWPAKAAAQVMNESFQNRTGKPLALLIGPPLYASEIALAAKDRPHIFPNADRRIAPWIKEKAVAEQGAVVFWPVTSKDTAPPTSLTAALPPFTPEAPLSLLWILPGSIDPVRLGWAIIPPKK